MPDCKVNNPSAPMPFERLPFNQVCALANFAIRDLQKSGQFSNTADAFDLFRQKFSFKEFPVAPLTSRRKPLLLYSPEALLLLGWFYYVGRYVEQNTTLGRQLFEIAADLGSAAAYLGLGYACENGLGAFQDNEQARLHYTEAARRHSAPAMLELTNKALLQKDCAAASEWLRQAVAVRYEPARKRAAAILGTGSKYSSLRPFVEQWAPLYPLKIENNSFYGTT